MIQHIGSIILGDQHISMIRKSVKSWLDEWQWKNRGDPVLHIQVVLKYSKYYIIGYAILKL